MSFELPFKLPTGWQVATVDELVKQKIIAKPLDGNHGGIHPKASDYIESGVPFVMASDLAGGRVDLIDCKFISEEQASGLRKGIAKAGDVLLSHKATIGRTAIVQDSKHDFIMLTPQVTYYRVINSSALSNIYLKAYFDSRFFQSILGLWAGAGSTRAYLGITGQLKLPIILPPIEIQNEISGQVHALNKKVNLNNEINQTLEEMAQTIFKSWFVDFDPVKAKMNGDQPEGMDAATASLFPEKLVESELGLIPEGWDAGTVGSVTAAKGGYAFKSKQFVDEGNPVIKIKNITSAGTVTTSDCQCVDDDIAKTASRFKLSDGDLLMAMTGATVGKSGIYVSDGRDGYLNQRVARFESKVDSTQPCWFTYNLVNKDSIFEQIVGAAQGSAQPNISSKGIEQVKTVIPTFDLISKYQELVAPLYAKWISNFRENSQLSELRDTLLPKLLSGEIELGQAQELAEVE
jgi:type I restriction enzyme S subunit